MRKLTRPVLAGALGACLLAPVAGPAEAAPRKIAVGDNWFVRPSGVPTVTVRRHTRVVWIWRGESIHNVRVARGPVRFGSGTKQRGRYARSMQRRGTYTLVCTVHGEDDQSMKLVVN